MSDNESRPGRAAQSPASEGAVMTPGLDATAALAAALVESRPWSNAAEDIIAALAAQGWRITSAPEDAGSVPLAVVNPQPLTSATADDPVSAQAAPDWNEPNIIIECPCCGMEWEGPERLSPRQRWEAAQANIEAAAVRAALEGHEPQMAGDGRDGDEHLGCSCGWEQSSDNDYEPWSRHVKP